MHVGSTIQRHGRTAKPHCPFGLCTVSSRTFPHGRSRRHRVVQTATGIGAIGPDHTQAPESRGQCPQQDACRCPVLRIRRRDHNQQHEAERINQDVPFAPGDVLGGVVASDATLLTGLRRLAVDDRTTRFPMSAGCFSHRCPNSVVDSLPRSVAAP